MKMVRVTVLLAAAFGVGGCGAQSEEVAKLKKENAELKAQVAKLSAGPAAAPKSNGGLPASLDKLYPPQAKGPQLLMAMHEMTMPLEAAMGDLLEGDKENAKKDFEGFKAGYAKVSKMVPEWQDRFPQGPVDAVGAAVATGDPGKVMGAFGQLMPVCMGCHVEHMTAVQFKYHWQDIMALKIKDPLMKKELPFAEFKHGLSGAFASIGANLQQGQPDSAKKSFQAFKARFDALADSCIECHDSDRHYYVDESVQKMITDLGKMLDKPPKDPADFKKAMMAIGQESCFKCHLVHGPAAMHKLRAAGPPKH